MQSSAFASSDSYAARRSLLTPFVAKSSSRFTWPMSMTDGHGKR